MILRLFFTFGIVLMLCCFFLALLTIDLPPVSFFWVQRGLIALVVCIALGGVLSIPWMFRR